MRISAIAALLLCVMTACQMEQAWEWRKDEFPVSQNYISNGNNLIEWRVLNSFRLIKVQLPSDCTQISLTGWCITSNPGYFVTDQEKFFTRIDTYDREYRDFLAGRQQSAPTAIKSDIKRHFGSSIAASAARAGVWRRTFWNMTTESYEDDYLSPSNTYIHAKVRSSQDIIGNCHWSFASRRLDIDDPNCHGVVFTNPKNEELVRLTITINNNSVTSSIIKINPKQVIVIVFGDSYISGEGIPDHNSDGFAFWLDHRCHRSLLSGASLGVAKLASEDPTRSWALVNLACSGAKIKSGILESYEGIEKPSYINDLASEFPDFVPRIGRKDTDLLPPQTKAAIDLLCDGAESCSRPEDTAIVVISAGGNDINFGEHVRNLIINDKKNINSSLLNELSYNLDNVKVNYKQMLYEIYRKLEPTFIIGLLYLDPTQRLDGSNLTWCDDRGLPIARRTMPPPLAMPFLVDAGEAEFANRKILVPMNAIVENLVGPDNVTRDLVTRSEPHGYCSDTPYVHSMSSAILVQGKIGNRATSWYKYFSKDWTSDISTGAFHPNFLGASLQGEEIAKMIQELMPR